MNEQLPHFYTALESYKDSLREEIKSVEIDTTNDKKIIVMGKIKDITKRIAEIQGELQNAKSFLIKGILTEADYVGLVPPLEKDIKELNVSLEDNERLLGSLSEYDRSAVIQNAIDSLNNIENESIENQNRIYRILFESLEMVNTIDEYEIRLKEKDVSSN